MSLSTLSRKLNPTDGDTRRLTCDDLERLDRERRRGRGGDRVSGGEIFRQRYEQKSA